MRKILDEIGVRLYAFRHIADYRRQCLLTLGLFATSLLTAYYILITEVF